MFISASLQGFISVLTALAELVMMGLACSAVMSLVYAALGRLSQWTHLDEPDPMEGPRVWRRAFDHLFLPFGQRAVSEHRTPPWNRRLFRLGVGGGVLAVATGTFLLSGTVLGIAGISASATGVVPDLSSVLDRAAALGLLVAIAAVTESTERADELVRVGGEQG